MRSENRGGTGDVGKQLICMQGVPPHGSTGDRGKRLAPLPSACHARQQTTGSAYLSLRARTGDGVKGWMAVNARADRALRHWAALAAPALTLVEP